VVDRAPPGGTGRVRGRGLTSARPSFRRLLLSVKAASASAGSVLLVRASSREQNHSGKKPTEPAPRCPPRRLRSTTPSAAPATTSASPEPSTSSANDARSRPRSELTEVKNRSARTVQWFHSPAPVSVPRPPAPGQLSRAGDRTRSARVTRRWPRSGRGRPAGPQRSPTRSSPGRAGPRALPTITCAPSSDYMAIPSDDGIQLVSQRNATSLLRTAHRRCAKRRSACTRCESPDFSMKVYQ
jgi:hypothetical protein